MFGVKIVFACSLIFFGIFLDTEKTQASVDYNCYCLDGSAIPFYYPNNKKLNTSDSDSCHQECANAGAKYFSFSNVSHVGTTKITKTPNTGSQTSGNNVQTGSVSQGTVGEESRFIKCGRSGQRMCTLCDLIAGLDIIIKFIMEISVGIGILAFAAGGVMYVVSAGDPGMKGKANKTMESAAIGFVIIFAGWLIVNTVILSLGSQTNANGEATFGMNVTGWGKFECSAKQR